MQQLVTPPCCSCLTSYTYVGDHCYKGDYILAVVLGSAAAIILSLVAALVIVVYRRRRLTSGKRAAM